MNCKAVKNHLPRYVDDDLPDRVLKEVGLHLVDCDECQAEARAYEESRQALRQLGGQPMTAPAIESLQRGVRYQVRRRALRKAANRALERTAWNPRGIAAVTLAAAALVLLIAAGFMAYLEYYAATQSGGPGAPTATADPSRAAPGTPGATDGTPPGLAPEREDGRLVPDALADQEEILYPIESVHGGTDYTFPATFRDIQPEPTPEPTAEGRKPSVPVRVKLVTF